MIKVSTCKCKEAFRYVTSLVLRKEVTMTSKIIHPEREDCSCLDVRADIAVDIPLWGIAAAAAGLTILISSLVGCARFFSE